MITGEGRGGGDRIELDVGGVEPGELEAVVDRDVVGVVAVELEQADDLAGAGERLEDRGRAEIGVAEIGRAVRAAAAGAGGRAGEAELGEPADPQHGRRQVDPRLAVDRDELAAVGAESIDEIDVERRRDLPRCR